MCLLAVVSCRAVDKSLNSRVGVYATVDEARAEGAVQRGLVPEGLPPGSSDLRVAYLDDGTQWGVVTFLPARGGALKALVGNEVISGAVRCGAPGRFEWWPRVLRDPIDLNTVHATGLRVYSAREGGRTWAVNWNQGRAFYWKE
jgi:hypothetical protein